MNSENTMNDESVVEEWLGVARRQGKLYMLRGTLAEFILDYRAYDPGFSASEEAASFRNGVLTVGSENADKFLLALNARRLEPTDVEAFVRSPEQLLAFIDFDSHRYVHSYYDLPLENYVPKGWRGGLGDPLLALRDQTSAH